RPGDHAADAEQTASPRTFLKKQSTWRTSRRPAGVATGHGADNPQTAAPNAWLGWMRPQSPFLPFCLSTQHAPATLQSLGCLSSGAGWVMFDDRQVADDSLPRNSRRIGKPVRLSALSGSSAN